MRLFLVSVLSWMFLCTRTPAQKLNAPGFECRKILSGNGMTALDFDASGRIFVCEKQGRVLVLSPDGKGGFEAPSVFVDIRSNVNPEGESGLLGIALDPKFATNRFVYLFHTTNDDQRLIRFTAGADLNQAVPGSELILLKGLPRTATNHKAGDIHFHPKDPKAIYLVLGDDTKRELASDLACFNGKLLRLDASNGMGLPDNPFFDGNADSVRSRVWARGFRNPFRFTFLPGANPDFVFVSENGDGTDRLARVKRGADAGWGRDGDKGLINPKDVNTKVLYTSKPCLTAITIAAKGPFAPNGPVLYAGNWFSQELLRWNIAQGGASDLTKISDDHDSAFLGDFKAVHSAFGPDGALYLTQTYYSESKGNDHQLVRIAPKTKPAP